MCVEKPQPKPKITMKEDLRGKKKKNAIRMAIEKGKGGGQ